MNLRIKWFFTKLCSAIRFRSAWKQYNFLLEEKDKIEKDYLETQRRTPLSENVVKLKYKLDFLKELISKG